MDEKKVDMYLITNANLFPAGAQFLLKEKLMNMTENQWNMLLATQFKDPTTALILSICLGCFGADRFYLNDVGLGIGKLLTCGGAYVWWLVDAFLISDATRQKNYEKLTTLLLL